MTGEQKEFGVDNTVNKKGRSVGIRIFGVTLENKVNLASLVAFIFSVVALVPQVIGWIKGPTITLLPPPQVFISADKTNSGIRQFVRIGARMSYINDGEKGYNAIVLYEFVNFEIAGTKYSQIAHNYVKFQLAEDRSMKIEDTDNDAVPIMIEGGSLASHESYFAPYLNCDSKLYEECPALTHVLYWDDFIHQIEEVPSQLTKDISFTFVARAHDRKHDPKPVTCRVNIDDAALKRIRRFNFAVLACKIS